ncbi:DEAD/DEAH box helicase [Effusibacillus consociatus]|uniref:DEAD/DEAH box helicase n=1 Tax=Effusibacillus consociatus TaxID=1117041 RepID=A0ABV9PZ33_9BACL
MITKPFLQEAWAKAGFVSLTAIQQKCIPSILEGKDIIAESPTGTGKTLAYLLPLLERINPGQKDIQAVILAPTRELVMQIHQEVQKFSEGGGILGVSLIGGADIKRQIEKLKKHPQIVVGTPGRVQELVTAKKMKMHEVKTIVVDEADQILEMGLMNTIKEVVKTTLRDRQLLFFSATISERVEKEGKEMMKDPDVIRITKQSMPDSRVEHIYFICEKRDKIDLLRRIVKITSPKAIAFVTGTSDFNELAAKLEYKGIPVGVLHGELKKTERETIIKNFRADKFPLLVATDVAARGLDIQGLSHVIHFDLPDTVEQYVHRSGRTGRMGAEGTVISIITNYQEGVLKKFSNQLGIPIQKKTLFMDRIVDQKPVRPKTKSARPSKTGKKKSRQSHSHQIK